MRDNIRAFIAIGSNLNQPIMQVKHAIRQLGQLPQTQIIKHSPFYATTPVDAPHPIPDFINAVVAVDTMLSANTLFDMLLAIEFELGRIRTGLANEARVIDLDLLLYGDKEIQTSDLIVPHPRMHQRIFVLQPLADIASDWKMPSGNTVAELLSNCENTGIFKVDDNGD